MRPLPESEILIGFAEIGVVFAGFAGISIVLGRRNPSDWSDLDAARLRWMIWHSFASAGFALLPLLIHGLGLSEPRTWFIASGLFLAFHLWFQGYAIVATHRLYREGVEDRVPLPMMVIVFSSALGALASLAANLASTEPGFGLYFPGLMFTAAFAALMFLRTLSVLRQ